MNRRTSGKLTRRSQENNRQPAQVPRPNKSLKGSRSRKIQKEKISKE